MYYRLIYGDIPHNKFWELLNIKNYPQFLQEFFDKLIPNPKAISLANSAINTPNTYLVYSTNLYSPWWQYLADIFDFTKLPNFVAFPDTVGFRKEDIDYWYQIFFNFPHTQAQNYTFYDGSLSVLRTLRHFWGQKVWLKSQEQPLTFIPDQIISL